MTPGTRAPSRRDLRPARVAMISMHTSPLDQPGTGDAGGMNVYIVELARRLAAAGTEVEIFTRSTSSQLPEVVEMSPGVLVRHVDAGPYQGLSKDELPAQLCEYSRGVLRAEAAAPPGWYDLVHSHYWLSGQVGALAAERWGVPLVHSMHTMAKVKNASLAMGDTPEPRTREIGEQQVVDAADRLVANTEDEARQLHDLYGAGLGEVSVVSPGVDLDLFTPGTPDFHRSAMHRKPVGGLFDHKDRLPVGKETDGRARQDEHRLSPAPDQMHGGEHPRLQTTVRILELPPQGESTAAHIHFRADDDQLAAEGPVRPGRDGHFQ